MARRKQGASKGERKENAGWKNLRPATKENAAIRGRAGGIKAQETHARKRTMREILDVLLSMPSRKRKNITTMESICAELINRAEDGNLRAIETLRDTIGEKPTEKDNNRVSGNVIVQWQQAIQGESSSSVSIGTTPDSNTISIDAQQAQAHEAIIQE